MSRILLLSLAGSSVLALAVGCTYDDTVGYEGTTVSRTDGLTTFTKPGRIDEVAGTYRGVGIADSAAEVKRVFGEQRPTGDEEAGTPLRYPEGGDSGPWAIQFGDDDPFGPSFRYYDVAFDFSGVELGAFTVVEPGAVTARGIEIGDELEAAGAAYPELECGTVNEDTEYEPYPACSGKLAPARYVWFGGDPIKSVAISTHELGGL